MLWEILGNFLGLVQWMVSAVVLNHWSRDEHMIVTRAGAGAILCQGPRTLPEHIDQDFASSRMPISTTLMNHPMLNTNALNQLVKISAVNFLLWFYAACA